MRAFYALAMSTKQRREAWKNAKVTPRNDHATYRLDESWYSVIRCAVVSR
jgi:hypothetical protein